MSKLLKSQLKSIVKECLVEILVEGLDSTQSVKKQVDTTLVKESKSLKNSMPKKTKKISPIYESKIDQFKDDPVLQSIFKDTVQTTLVETIESEKRGPAGSDSPFTPEELFGDEMTKAWEKLAFAKK